MPLIEYFYKYNDSGDAIVVGSPVDVTEKVGERRVLELEGTSVPYEVMNDDRVKVMVSQATLGHAGFAMPGFEENLGESGIGAIEEIVVKATNSDYVIHLLTGFRVAIVRWEDRNLKPGDKV